MAYTSEEIAKFFPRLWNGNFSIVYGINNDGDVTPLNVADSGALSSVSVIQGMGPDDVPLNVNVNSSGEAIVTASNISFYATGSVGNSPIIVSGVSDSEGWIDIGPYARFTLTAAGTGTFDPDGTGAIAPVTLDFDGSIKVEYRNFRYEPTEGTLISPVLVNTPRVEISDPTDPVDILGISWIRIYVDGANSGTGPCAVFGTIK